MTGYRPPPQASGRRWLASLSIGAVAAVMLVAVGGLVMRTEPTPTGPGNPVGATAEDAIEPVATMTYLGPRATETIFHAAYPIGFRIEEVGGPRLMGGGMDEPCLRTELAKSGSAVLPFAKAGSPDDPMQGFDRAWYEDPVLRLPAGTWRIVAYLDVFIGDCGGERHQLTVENVVRIQ